MKLLTPTEVRDTKAQDTARTILRTNELNKAADQARKNLANAEADFQRVLAGQRARWAVEEQEHQTYVAEQQAELKILEDRKEKAMVPIHLLEKEAQDTLQKAKIARQANEEALEETEVLREHLETKLDEVGGREIDVKARETKARALELALYDQQRVTDDNAKEIAKQFELLKIERLRSQKELEEMRAQLILKSRSIQAKSESLARTTERLREWEKRLQDERGTLDRIIIRSQNQQKGE